MVPRAAQIIAFCEAHKDLEEDPRGSNNGNELRRVLAGTMFEPPDSWCMFFTEAAIKAGYEGFGPIPQWIEPNGSCASQYKRGRAFGKLSEWPATGCIVLLRGGPYGHHHAGIVSKVDEKEGRFWYWSGNTNNNGSSNGYGVFLHSRLRGSEDFVIW